jgi:hypothetical protein
MGHVYSNTGSQPAKTFLKFVNSEHDESGGSVSTVSGYGLDDLAIKV